MAGVASGSKERIETVASDILARRGYNGMGLKAVSDAAKLPYGSIYHHFPGGKEQIASSAISTVSDILKGLLDALFAGTPPDKAVRALFDYMAGRLAESDWTNGCPIGTPAQDGADDSAAVREACAKAFSYMIDPIAEALVRAGLKKKAAHDLATTVIASYEGATILAKVQCNDSALRSTGDAMVRLVRSAVG